MESCITRNSAEWELLCVETRLLVLKIKEWVLTNKVGLALKRRVKNENLEKKWTLLFILFIRFSFLTYFCRWFRLEHSEHKLKDVIRTCT